MNLYNKDIYVCHMIVTENKADKVEALFRKHNAGFVLNQPAKGTVHQRILNIIGVNNSHRNYLNGMFSKKRLQSFVDEANKVYHLDQPGHGILFVTKMNQILMSDMACYPESEEESMTNEVLITAITNYGNSTELIDAARAVGARGATILKGHGTVSEDAQKFFGVAIEPEKEVIMIIVKKELEQKVMEAIHTQGNFEQESNGIVFSQSLTRTLGISG